MGSSVNVLRFLELLRDFVSLGYHFFLHLVDVSLSPLGIQLLFLILQNTYSVTHKAA